MVIFINIIASEFIFLPTWESENTYKSDMSPGSVSVYTQATRTCATQWLATSEHMNIILMII